MADNTPPANDVPTIFISYAHADATFLDELKRHLVPFVRAGKLRVWDDTHIPAGERWFDEIKKHLTEADMGVLLVSANFLASEFIHNHELNDLLTKKRRIWFLVGHCVWTHTALLDFQAAYDPKKPLADLPPGKRDAAWVEIVEKIIKATDSLDRSAPILSAPPVNSADALIKKLGRLHDTQIDRLILSFFTKDVDPWDAIRRDPRGHKINDFVEWATRTGVLDEASSRIDAGL